MSITAKRIKQLREENNYTQQQISDQLGISLSGYRKIEYGDREPNLDVIRDLSIYYNVTSDYILGLNDLQNKLSEKMFDVVMAHNKLTIAGMELELYKKEDSNSYLVSMATRNLHDAEAIYSKMLFEYMIEFFNQPNPNPEEDHVLRGKFPVKFSYQPDLFNNVAVSLTCADGVELDRIAYYTGAIPERAIEKAENFINRHKEYFRMKH